MARVRGPASDLVSFGYGRLTRIVFRSITDVVLGRVVTPPVYLPEPGPVEVHRDGWLSRRVAQPVDAPIVRQHDRDPILHPPLAPPELLQAGIGGAGRRCRTLRRGFPGAWPKAKAGSPPGNG